VILKAVTRLRIPFAIASAAIQAVALCEVACTAS